MILKAVTAALVVVSLHTLSIPDPLIASMVHYRGMYRNYIYGYSISIPSGLVGVTDPSPSPSPQHGILIILTDKKEQISNRRQLQLPALANPRRCSEQLH